MLSWHGNSNAFVVLVNLVKIVCAMNIMWNLRNFLDTYEWDMMCVPFVCVIYNIYFYSRNIFLLCDAQRGDNHRKVIMAYLVHRYFPRIFLLPVFMTTTIRSAYSRRMLIIFIVSPGLLLYLPLSWIQKKICIQIY